MRNFVYLCFSLIVASCTHNKVSLSKYSPRVIYTSNFIEQKKGTIEFQIPEIYEMVNIAIALTDHAHSISWLVYKDSKYYEDVIQYFSQFNKHPFVLKLNALLEKRTNLYSTLKMDSFSFIFTADKGVGRHPVYKVTGFLKENSLKQLTKEMTDFYLETRFDEFYKRNKTVYSKQISFFKTEIDPRDMRQWLDQRFQTNKNIDFLNVVFSPLVYGWQSAKWFEGDSFKELQAHVNFPYPPSEKALRKLKYRSLRLLQGSLLFTEINHGYLAVPSRLHREAIADAIEKRDFWLAPSKGDNYYSGNALFEEYLNWGLVHLWYLDRVQDPYDQKFLTERNIKNQVEKRGFLRFSEFCRFLETIYRKSESKKIDTLYPQLIHWFKSQGKAKS